MLFADMGKLHSAASRAVRCDSSLHNSTDASIYAAFAEFSGRGRASRSSSLLEQLSHASSSSRNGSALSNSDARKEDLPQALDTILAHIRESMSGRRCWIQEKAQLGSGVT